jgi:hypothetical protein
MFLNKVKDFYIKNKIKKSLSDVKLIAADNYIKSVAIIFDETYFYEKEALIKELILNGFDAKNIHFIVFKNKIKKGETFDYVTFSNTDFNWDLTISNEKVNKFVAFPFDLLINYYDLEKAPLILTTKLSNAKFKVGFGAVDSRLNHFMINTDAENYKVFIDELSKYLKILNKI